MSSMTRAPMIRMVSHATPQPAVTPTVASNMLSAMTGRTTAHRDPPMAARMAVSRSRCTPLANSRQTTLAVAINSTMHTAPSSNRSDGRTDAALSLSRGTTRADSPRGLGRPLQGPPSIRPSSFFAPADGRSRRQPADQGQEVRSAGTRACLLVGESEGNPNVALDLRGSMGHPELAGRTPTTVVGTPSSSMVRPIAARSDPNCDRQYSSLTTATGGASGRTLLLPSNRPCNAATPRSANSAPLARTTLTALASSPTNTCPAVVAIAARLSRLRSVRARSAKFGGGRKGRRRNRA